MKKTFFIYAAFLSFHILSAQLNNNKKILIVATSADNLVSKPEDHTWGCYAPEISDFYSTLYSYGFRAKDIDIVSPKGGKVPLAVNMHYPKKFNLPDDEKKALEEKVNNSLSPSQVKPEDYNVIYYSGGFSCLVDYSKTTDIGAIAASIYNNGGIVAAVCDGVAGLIPIKVDNSRFLVNTKTITTNGFKNKTDTVTKQLINEGAIISDEKIVTDGKLITARGVMPITVANQILSLLGFVIDKKE
jgi:putative intracellular protease/amidase